MVDRIASTRGTIRFRITAIAGLAVAVVLVITGFFLVNAQRRQLTANLDVALEQRLESLEVFVAGDGSLIPNVLPDGGNSDFIAQIVVDGTVVGGTPGLTADQPLIDVGPTGVTSRTVARVVGDDAYRLLARTSAVDGGDVTVIVGLNSDDVEDAAQVLVASLLVGGPVVVVLLVGLVWWLVGRTLAPVEHIRRRVGSIGEAGIGTRVPVPETNDEIARLAVTMNAMLDRIDSSVARQNDFVADASHELRSPLTRLRTMLEVELKEHHPEATRQAYRSLLSEVVGLQELVEGLLQLARADASSHASTMQLLDLDELVRAEVRDARAAHGAVVEAAELAPVMVKGDGAALGRAVRNIVGNAVRYADSRVSVRLRTIDGLAELSITDDGPGIPFDHQKSVFERFTRVDSARTRDDGGAGLGLAISKEIIMRHNGTIEIDPSHDSGVRMVVRLPASD